MIYKYKQILSLLILIAINASVLASPIGKFDNTYNQFLEDVKENSIRNRDWDASAWDKYIREQKVNAPINDKETLYHLVRTALGNLNDHHSFLMIRNEPSNQIKKSETLTNTVRVENGIGIITIPNNMDDVVDSTPESLLNEHVVSEFHEKLDAIKHQVTKGWIIDISQNSGGNMYPMIGSLSDFFVNQNLGGYYVYQYGKKPVTQKINFDGKNFKFDDDQGAMSFKKQYPIGTVRLPTVVIISNETASSGEMLALALERQPYIKMIGQPTYGLATCNSMMALQGELGNYMLTVGNDLDKDDQPLLDERVMPGVLVNPDDKNPIEVAKEIIEST